MDNKPSTKRIVRTALPMYGPGAYLLVDRDHQIRYVGSTEDLSSRGRTHEYVLSKKKDSNARLQQVSDQQPLLFVPLPTDTKGEAVELEQRLIDRFHGNGILCNMSTDATKNSGGYELTDGTRQRMSESRKGMPSGREGSTLSESHRQALIQSNLGKPKSEATRLKIALAARGNSRATGSVRTDEHKLAVSEANGQKVNIGGVDYRSYRHAADAFGISPQTVLNRCNSEKFKDWNNHG